MPIPAVRIISPTVKRDFGRFGDAVEVPDLTDVQSQKVGARENISADWIHEAVVRRRQCLFD